MNTIEFNRRVEKMLAHHRALVEGYACAIKDGYGHQWIAQYRGDVRVLEAAHAKVQSTRRYNGATRQRLT